MKIGVVATGNMGRSIGILLAQLGHQVLFGSRRVEEAKVAADLAGSGARAGSNDEAARFGDLLVWGVRGVSASEVLTDIGVTAGKIVIDMNNNETRTDGGAGPDGPSIAEILQQQLPAALVVKAFNTFPMEVFEVPADDLRTCQASVWLASDHEAARQTVSGLVTALGFTPIALPALRYARMLEGIADIIRNLIPLGISPYTAISAVTMPTPTVQRLGGRRESRLK